jgi:hypothetical protein
MGSELWIAQSAQQVADQIAAELTAFDLGLLQAFPPHAAVLAAPTTNASYAVRVVPHEDQIINGLVVGVGTASGNVRAAILEKSGTDFVKPAQSSSTVASGSNAPMQIPFTAPYSAAKGVPIWFTFATDNSTITIARVAGSIAANAWNLQAVSKAGNFAIVSPDPVAGWSGVALVPWIGAY